MKTGFPICYRMTQAQVDAGEANAIVGARIEIIDAAGTPTGAVLESGGAGVAPTQTVSATGTSSGGALKLWEANKAVDIGEVRRATLAVGTIGVGDFMSSNSARTTGATFDAAEAANWTELPNDPDVALKTDITDGSVQALFDSVRVDAVHFLATATDLNTLTSTGWFNVQNAVNGPVGGGWYYIFNGHHRDGATGVPNMSYMFQLAKRLDVSGVNNLLMRTNYNGSWTTWATLATTDLATTAVAGLMSSADKTKLDGVATGAEANVQADWNQTTTTADSFIVNKPTIFSLSSTTPAMDGTAAVGAGTTAARADHVHASDTSKQATLESGTNVKTVGGQSILGAGDIAISSASSVLVVTAPIAIKITGAAGAGTNYPVKITIGESSGATGANFNLGAAGTFPASKNATSSFIFWDSTGVVPFWIEKVTGTTPNRVAHVWISPTVDLSSGTITVFLSTEATNTVRSNGANVFTLFDDFDVATLDATKWDTSVISGQTIASGILTFGGGNTARRLLTLNTVGDGFEIMSLMRASDTAASTSNFGFAETGASASTFNYRNVWDSASAVMVGTIANTLATNIDNAAGVRQVMRIGRAGGAGRFSSETPANTFTTATGVPTAVTKSTIYNTYDNSTEIDWVAIKKFVATEPAFSSAIM